MPRGERWPKWANGGGSSLELIDPRSDHRLSDNWADSDETAKAGWTTIEFTGRLDHGDGSAANSLQVLMMGAGECLLDDVEVLGRGAPTCWPIPRSKPDWRRGWCKGITTLPLFR